MLAQLILIKIDFQAYSKSSSHTKESVPLATLLLASEANQGKANLDLHAEALQVHFRDFLPIVFCCEDAKMCKNL